MKWHKEPPLKKYIYINISTSLGWNLVINNVIHLYAAYINHHEPAKNTRILQPSIDNRKEKRKTYQKPRPKLYIYKCKCTHTQRQQCTFKQNLSHEMNYKLLPFIQKCIDLKVPKNNNQIWSLHQDQKNIP